MLQEIQQLLPKCLVRDRIRIENRLNDLKSKSGDSPVFRNQLQALLRQVEQSCEILTARAESRPRVSYPAELPISLKCEDIIQAIRANQIVVIAGETGSGKTTQIPKMCLEAGQGIFGKIGCTQPRRVAAQSISRRIAEELNVQMGREVGCKVRFNDETSPQSYIKLMTDGILLAETQSDSLLSEYDTIIIDEAHERSLNIDFLLGYLKLLLAKRPDLKLVVTSATIDTQAFSEAFGGAPIIEVSGRTYPVEVLYMPLNDESDEYADITYIDGAVSAIETIIDEPISGDVLVFMPGERDIRETCDRLEGRRFFNTEILPLFARLSSQVQQQIFHPSDKRRIIVATNIAETSLTIPNIRYVVDAGLARVSRYSPRVRTKRLPIEPVSQSSANQRKGRCGRVSDGVCIRLYSEENFLDRPEYSQPEIQRANLADVILRMKAFHLGDIETFPFILPPKPHAIKGGYLLLQELGALDEQKQLTEIGEELARLPIDPTVGRMILEARHENALKEVMVIAAGLSIQDPRERPMDQQQAADSAHKRFLDPQSDFMSLLNIWNSFHDTWEKLKTQSQLRRFCKDHFVSYLRMREWRDIHKQIREALRSRKDFRINDKDANYDAIHRSILTGLLTLVGNREESNLYRATGNRKVMIFPGSVLFDRNARKKSKSKTQKPSSTEKKPQPKWVMSGEFMETSQLFARMVARIQPEWIVELGEHLCRSTYEDPHWDAKAGRVLIKERLTLGGLEVLMRKIDFSKVHPADATEMFIREALVPGEISVRHRFLDHNMELVRKVENVQTRTRDGSLHRLDQILFKFYTRHISNVSSVHDLNRFVQENGKNDSNFLCISEGELLGDMQLDIDEEAFPEEIEVGGERVRIDYAYAPGEEHDGATIRLSVRAAQNVPESITDWVIPGIREQMVMALFKALPKSLRKELVPLPEKVKTVCAELSLEGDSFTETLSRFLLQRYGIQIPASEWRLGELPEYLRPRVEIVDRQEKVVATGRDLKSMVQSLERTDSPIQQDAWSRIVENWEHYRVTEWNFPDLPERIEVTEVNGIPIYAWPGLQVENGEVHVRLFREQNESLRNSAAGFEMLCSFALGKDIAWLQKDLRALSQVKELYVTLGSYDELLESSFVCLKRYLFERKGGLQLTRKAYEETVKQAKERIPGLAQAYLDLMGQILRLRQQLLLLKKPYATLTADVAGLLPKAFPERIPFPQMKHLPRYLKAMQVRSERATQNLTKDQQRAQQLEPYLQVMRNWNTAPTSDPTVFQKRYEFYWMFQEFKVSLFAQELGTAFPVSAKRLNEFIVP